MKQVSAAFVRAQRAFGPALKTNTNPHFRSKYADLSACVEAVIDALNAEGIAMVQRTAPSDSGVIVETVFIHESGESMSSGQLHVPAAKHDPQGFGSALTYARRYSLMAACGIAPEDDDGNAASKPRPAADNLRISPTMGVIKTLPASRQAVINDCADAMRERYAADDVMGCYEIYIDITDVEEKTALWGALQPDSKLRAAIKRHGESLKQQLKEAA